MQFRAMLKEHRARLRYACLALSLGALIAYDSMWPTPYGAHVRSVFGMSNEMSSNANEAHVAIIGGGGNIGSYLTQFLTSANLTVVAFDVNPNIPGLEVAQRHSRSLTRRDLQRFGTVIFLGGCTGRRACAGMSFEERTQANVNDVEDLVSKCDPGQHFITASTSAVSEGRRDALESDEVFSELLDEYSTSMFERENRLRQLASGSRSPWISMLRFGTVVGTSPGQRTDLLVPSLFKSAYTEGVLHVQGYDVMRSFLALPDLARAVHTLILRRKPVQKPGTFAIWNLASFHAKILKVATTVASITGAKLDMQSSVRGYELADPKFKGFSLSTAAFRETFGFEFQWDLQSTLSEFDANMPDSAMPKGSHAPAKNSAGDSIACPVCGSTDSQLVVDLGEQPFANHFVNDTEEALESPRFPLKLVRCRVCNHYHLSQVASRSELFEHYLYRSGTSSTLKAHFDWLAGKVQEESGNLKSGSVLEIACNDGSQLDSFKALGWKTYGVDPAKNIAEIAQKAHTVRVGFWPLDFPELPKGDALTAITAQNVFAHVPQPVDFLKGCAKVMGPKTKLYIQTSQCNMQQLGQFDTMYHEHISFFTGHSFKKAADLAGLEIVKFETVPIHGESCLVTMEKSGDNKDNSLEKRLATERRDGVTSDFFAERFRSRAIAIRDWVTREIRAFRSKGYVVGAYGAAAKGMTLLHFILGASQCEEQFLDFVLDDADLKQGTFCPGTEIPVFPSAHLQTLVVPLRRPVAILVLAWNFFDEIAKKIAHFGLRKRESITTIVPFPEPAVVRLQKDGTHRTLRAMPNDCTSVPNVLRNESRSKTVLVTHARNEDMLMPFFIIQHAPMFDEAFLIDFESTDRTVQLVADYAPACWRVVNSSQGQVFDAEVLDQQVSQIESWYPNDWVMALTVTEFLIFPNMRARLFRRQLEDPSPTILKHQALFMQGYDGVPLRHFRSLLKQRHVWVKSTWFYNRVMHRQTTNHIYGPGRHEYNFHGRGKDTATRLVNTEGFIAKWHWTPWPESAERIVHVGATIPKSDVDRKRGFQHTANLLAGLEGIHKTKDHEIGLELEELQDLCDDESHPDEDREHVPAVFFREIGGVCHA
ncbi:unnamed protein product [Effrenium voratum]|uniref:Uncharacterized protein n=2 Tax=Effrenium voratum TaxID=2562239 RepID=A0AA36I2I3_9DINO|nr:unnamed protein product [Effrenium voratum]